jgi:hypothetical protein
MVLKEPPGVDDIDCSDTSLYILVMLVEPKKELSLKSTYRNNDGLLFGDGALF